MKTENPPLYKKIEKRVVIGPIKFLIKITELSKQRKRKAMGKKNLTYAPGETLKITAAEALEPYRVIKASGAYANANEAGIGVTEIAWDSGDLATIITSGTAMVECSEAVTAGGWLSCAADGKVKALDAAEHKLGICLTPTSGAGFTTILLKQCI
jgi:hypothetical protein